MSDLVGNPEVRFSCVGAHVIIAVIVPINYGKDQKMA